MIYDLEANETLFNEKAKKRLEKYGFKFKLHDEQEFVAVLGYETPCYTDIECGKIDINSLEDIQNLVKEHVEITIDEKTITILDSIGRE
jgi:hypothetical protein